MKQPCCALELFDQLVGLGLHFGRFFAVELHQHQRLGFADDEIEIVTILEALGRQPQHEPVEQLGGRRLAGKDRAHRRHGRLHRVEVQHDDGAYLGQGKQVHERFGEGAQCAFGAGDQLRQVELGAGIHLCFAAARFGDQSRSGNAVAALGHEFVEVIAAHPAEDGRKARGDFRSVFGHDALDFAMHVPDQVAARLFEPQLARPQRCKRRGASVGQHDVERDDAVDGLAVPDRACAGRVVADHAAQVGAAAGGHVGAELQLVGCGRRIQLVEHDTRLHARGARLRINVDPVHVLAEVDDQPGPDRLAGQAGAAPARNDRQAFFGGHLRGADDVVASSRQHDSPGHDLVNAGIGGVQSPRIFVEKYLAGQAFFE